MPILSSRPSRSYATVEHDPDGLSAVGTGPYGSEGVKQKYHGIKTYRPPLTETHLRRPGMYDTHPSSSFAPLPSALGFNLNLSSKQKQRKDEEVAAGQRAELDHILEPEFKSVSNYSLEDSEGKNVGGKSRRYKTAGGLASGSSGAGGGGLGLRSSASVGNFRDGSSNASGSAAYAGDGRANGMMQASASGRGMGNGSGGVAGGLLGLGGKKSNLGGVYMDSNGKIHDTEYDPFKGISDMTRMKSRRRSAFGSDRRKGSDAGSTSTEGSVEMLQGQGQGHGQHEQHGREQDYDDAGGSGSTSQEESVARKRQELERRRIEELNGYTAARRKSFVSQRSERSEKSEREKGGDGHSHHTHSGHKDGSGNEAEFEYDLPLDRLLGGRSKSSQGNYVPSPLSPTFSQPSASSQTRSLATIEDSEEMPIKSTEITRPSRPPPSRKDSQTQAQVKAQTQGRARTSSDSSAMPPPPIPASGASAGAARKEKVEMKAGTKKVTGFNAPSSPMPPVSATFTTSGSSSTPGTLTNQSYLDATSLNVPRSARLSSDSRLSRHSSDTSRNERVKPAPRPREDLFPETPAQMKRREERERRAGRDQTPLRQASNTHSHIHSQPHHGRDGMVSPGPGYSYARRSSGLAIDPQLASSGRGRLLPEIEIVEDDDPRIVFYPEGKQTRVQTVHDHVIRTANLVAGQGVVHQSSQQGQNSTGRFANGYDHENGIDDDNDSLFAPPPAFHNHGEGLGAGGSARRPSSTASLSIQHTTGSGRDPSEILDQGPYLPSRWAKGDKQLRTTEDEKEKYRPMEWGGKKGELGGRVPEWKPTTKETVKKEWKDFQTNARFSLFRATKKLGRKTEF